MRNVTKIGLAATLLLSLAACGSRAEGPQVAAIPGATTSAGAGPATESHDADRQLPLGATKEEINRVYDAYYACWTQHGVPSAAAPGGNGGPLLSYKENTKKYQPAVDACADKEPLDAPELDPHQNPSFADDLRKELQCDKSHGLSMEIRQGGTDDASIWVAPETKANLAKANSDAGMEIQRQCEISAFTEK
jgi:predicted small lipoprotein YifL